MARSGSLDRTRAQVEKRAQQLSTLDVVQVEVKDSLLRICSRLVSTSTLGCRYSFGVCIFNSKNSCCCVLTVLFAQTSSFSSDETDIFVLLDDANRFFDTMLENFSKVVPLDRQHAQLTIKSPWSPAIRRPIFGEETLQRQDISDASFHDPSQWRRSHAVKTPEQSSADRNSRKSRRKMKTKRQASSTPTSG